MPKVARIKSEKGNGRRIAKKSGNENKIKAIGQHCDKETLVKRWKPNWANYLIREQTLKSDNKIGPTLCCQKMKTKLGHFSDRETVEKDEKNILGQFCVKETVVKRGQLCDRGTVLKR